MNFNKVIEKYRKHSFTERDKGARFERLMQSYLLTDPKYSHLLKKVWLWNEFPYDWSKETGHPRYIRDLLLSVINVSMQTVEVVEGLPRVGWNSDNKTSMG